MNKRLSIGLRMLVLCTMFAVSVPAFARQTPPGLKLFAGKVLEVNAKENWFVMKGGGSKRYPRVKVLLDKATRWSGLPRKKNVVLVGDPVRVEAAPVKDITFRAVTIKVQDPTEKPTLGAPNPKA